MTLHDFSSASLLGETEVAGVQNVQTVKYEIRFGVLISYGRTIRPIYPFALRFGGI